MRCVFNHKVAHYDLYYVVLISSIRFGLKRYWRTLASPSCQSRSCFRLRIALVWCRSSWPKARTRTHRCVQQLRKKRSKSRLAISNLFLLKLARSVKKWKTIALKFKHFREHSGKVHWPHPAISWNSMGFWQNSVEMSVSNNGFVPAKF